MDEEAERRADGGKPEQGGVVVVPALADLADLANLEDLADHANLAERRSSRQLGATA